MNPRPQAAHTPGPWRVQYGMCTTIRASEATADVIVASVTSRRDARLIAQAPALLAALERCVPWLGKMIADGGQRESVLPNDAVNALERAEAAIKAARGEK